MQCPDICSVVAGVLKCYSQCRAWKYRRLNESTDSQGTDEQRQFDFLVAICEGTFPHMQDAGVDSYQALLLLLGLAFQSPVCN